MERVILHSDANAFYASVECLYTPAIRQKPVAVCGSVEERHGIVLAKNEYAKRAGVKTGMAVWQCRQVCPGLVVVPPDFDLYLHFSGLLRRVYQSYTDHVESFGLDECWLDLSEPSMDIAKGARIAEQIRQRIRRELGVTVSIGVSFNKVFAKLASDMKKPDAITVISRENYRELAWPLPVSDLLYVGPRTAKKLAHIGINTIGQLAGLDLRVLQSMLGKNGVMLKAFAKGLDQSPVMLTGTEDAIKSIGNSTTPPHDIETPEEAKAILYLLAESVAERLRRQGFQCRRVSIHVRTTDLFPYGCQCTLNSPSNITREISRAAYELFLTRYNRLLPLRSMGLHCGRLSPADAPQQLDFLGDARQRRRQESLDQALDSLRYRFGHTIVRRGVVLADSSFARVNPATQIIHPVAFLREDRGIRYDRP